MRTTLAFERTVARPACFSPPLRFAPPGAVAALGRLSGFPVFFVFPIVFPCGMGSAALIAESRPLSEPVRLQGSKFAPIHRRNAKSTPVFLPREDPASIFCQSPTELRDLFRQKDSIHAPPQILFKGPELARQVRSLRRIIPFLTNFPL
ncbi:MAG: hypothetical protein ACYDBT_09665 [Desulfobulbaceae bacterium]